MLLPEPIMEKLFRKYKKDADAADKEAMYHVGICYSIGFGVAKDEKSALEWCSKAAKAGSLDALFYLAENCEIGTILDATMAFTWYLSAAEAGHIKAMWRVVCCYFHGYGVQKDLVKCRHWKGHYNSHMRITSDVQVNAKETVLHRAVRQGNTEVVKRILGHGKDNIDVKNKDGQTPLYLAAENGLFDIVWILAKEFQADASVKDNKGETALSVAAKKGHLEIAMALFGGFQVCAELNLSSKSI